MRERQDRTGPDDATFRRGQVEHALWRLFSAGRAGASVPSVFRTRIRKLLDIDRRGNFESDTHPNGLPLAFSDESPGGKGVDAAYTLYDVFLLSIALDLLDAGYKQSEIVFLLKHFRKGLGAVFLEICKHPAHLRQITAIEDDPGAPQFIKNGITYADRRVYMLLERVELKEAYPRVRQRRPLIMRPFICHGLALLQTELDRLNHEHRKQLIMEIAERVTALRSFLAAAEEPRRGRPAAKRE